MKFRVIGLVLAAACALSLTLSAFAATEGGNNNFEGPVPPGVNLEVIIRPEKSDTPFYLDGVPMDTLVYQTRNNVSYITVESFVAFLDREAVIEEENGVVTVNALTVTRVVDVENEGVWNPYGTAEEIGEANVEEETLNLTAQIDAFYAVANGRYLYVENGVMAVEGKAALPVRVLAKVFNLSVAYDPETKTVQLTHQEGAGAYLADADSYYNSDALYWLSRIISSESGNQSLTGKIAVGNVVMNRVESPRFPNNIYDVIFQRNQFSPVASGSIYRTPNEQSVVAAKLVLDGAEVLENVLFFNRAGMNTYAARTRTHVATIGAHAFYA